MSLKIFISLLLLNFDGIISPSLALFFGGGGGGGCSCPMFVCPFSPCQYFPRPMPVQPCIPQRGSNCGCSSGFACNSGCTSSGCVRGNYGGSLQGGGCASSSNGGNTIVIDPSCRYGNGHGRDNYQQNSFHGTQSSSGGGCYGNQQGGCSNYGCMNQAFVNSQPHQLNKNCQGENQQFQTQKCQNSEAKVDCSLPNQQHQFQNQGTQSSNVFSSPASGGCNNLFDNQQQNNGNFGGTNCNSAGFSQPQQNQQYPNRPLQEFTNNNNNGGEGGFSNNGKAASSECGSPAEGSQQQLGEDNCNSAENSVNPAQQPASPQIAPPSSQSSSFVQPSQQSQQQQQTDGANSGDAESYISPPPASSPSAQEPYASAQPLLQQQQLVHPREPTSQIPQIQSSQQYQTQPPSQQTLVQPSALSTEVPPSPLTEAHQTTSFASLTSPSSAPQTQQTLSGQDEFTESTESADGSPISEYNIQRDNRRNQGLSLLGQRLAKVTGPPSPSSDIYDDKLLDIDDYLDAILNTTSMGITSHEKSNKFKGITTEQNAENIDAPLSKKAANLEGPKARGGGLALKADPKCSSETLRIIMQENIVSSPTISKQLIFSAGRQSIDVVCSRNKFSYTVISSKVFCEITRGPTTCFAFLQP